MLPKSLISFGILHGYDWEQYVEPILDDVRGLLVLEEHANDVLEEVVRRVPMPDVRTFWRDQYQEWMTVEGWRKYAFVERAYDLDWHGQLAAGLGKSIGVQAFNEPQAVENLALMAAYGRWEAERAWMLHDQYPGTHAIVGNFGMGTTSPELMRAFLPPLLDLYKKGVYFELGLHEYSYMVPWCLIRWDGYSFLAGTDLFNGGVVPPVPARTLEAWLYGRWRHLGIPPWLPIVLTEFGTDRISFQQAVEWGFPTRDGDTFSGIKTIQTRVPREFGAVSDSARGALLSDLIMWADTFNRQFPQVRRMHYFSIGPHHAQQFVEFDIADTVAYWPLVAKIRALGHTEDRAYRAQQWFWRRYWAKN